MMVGFRVRRLGVLAGATFLSDIDANTTAEGRGLLGLDKCIQVGDIVKNLAPHNIEAGPLPMWR